VTALGLGQSSAVGIGGDPVNGLKHIDVMKMFNDDPETEAVIMIGEIGGGDEETAARWVKDNMKKPIVGFIAGVTAPPGKRMGHAGAIISGGTGTAEEKIAAFKAVKVPVAEVPADIPGLIRKRLSTSGKISSGRPPAARRSTPAARRKIRPKAAPRARAASRRTTTSRKKKTTKR